MKPKTSWRWCAFIFGFGFTLMCPVFAVSQEPPKAVLVDELEQTNCEILMARLDAFFYALQEKPTYHGYVVINGDARDMRTNFVYEGMVQGHTNFRRFDWSRLSLVRGKLGEKLKIEFWQIPPGIDHEFAKADWSFVVPRSTKPFKFYDTAGSGVCPGDFSTKSFAEYLFANPQSKANIVIRGKSSRVIAREEKQVNDLVKGLNIPRKRLRVFRVIDGNYDWAVTEYWFVP